ncbi:hypothetical protein S7711_11595 [Stachybotrys chartarum IBT 7711]|uniref:Uncharacterized protein n=1 Tax=Stachybotrys chartarum (strain CBS 109288 / IBT 7711) TaxID=1280523 RepID=A0A084B5Z0_STACB|nr:hypothetical protein S7711_11595 [Stachybotrys chartarum IBT 7711]
MEALRQFSGDWEQRIGNGSVIRIPMRNRPEYPRQQGLKASQH